MTPAERISFLVYDLEGGNAKHFADKCNIPPASLSRIRNGKAEPGAYYPRILNAYPDVRRAWLVEGIGEPYKSQKDKGELVKKIEGLEKEVRGLREAIEKLAPEVLKLTKNR